MPLEPLRHRMRGSDAIFLYFEKKEIPLHIGSVAILDGDFDDECVAQLETRLPEIPRYRQRVMFPPFSIAHPTWEYDPAFDFRSHVRRIRIDPPGTEQQLAELSGQIFTPLMDRERPLWDLTVVDGLEGGRSALITRVHHCMVDGVAGIELMNVMYDPSRKPRRVEAQPFTAPRLPTPGELLVEGLAGTTIDIAERLLDAQVSLLRIAQAFTSEKPMASLQRLLAIAPEMLRPADRLPFNRPCNGVRGHCWTTVPFAETRAIRAALGVTINDVALAAVTGAVMRYVEAHREPLKGRFVRFMVPVSVRTEDTRNTGGNEVSMMPLSVPLDIADPVERAKAISLRAVAMKSARVADMVLLIANCLGWTPPMLQTSLAAMPFLPQPVLIINTVCTNVPGPMIPMYASGRELLTYYPHVPCGADVGLGVAIQSYNQKLHFGVTYDGQAAPDGELFRDFIVEAYEEMRAAAGIEAVLPEFLKTRSASPAARPSGDVRAHREAAQEETAVAAASSESVKVEETSAGPRDAVGPAGRAHSEPAGEKSAADAASVGAEDASGVGGKPRDPVEPAASEHKAPSRDGRGHREPAGKKSAAAADSVRAERVGAKPRDTVEPAASEHKALSGDRRAHRGDAGKNSAAAADSVRAERVGAKSRDTVEPAASEYKALSGDRRAHRGDAGKKSVAAADSDEAGGSKRQGGNTVLPSVAEHPGRRDATVDAPKPSRKHTVEPAVEHPRRRNTAGSRKHKAAMEREKVASK